MTDSRLQDSEGDTALHEASRFGHTEVVEKLVAFGADRDIKNNQGHTANDVAILFDKQDTVAYYAKL